MFFIIQKTNMPLYLILCIGDKCIIPPLTTPIPKPDPTLPPDIKTAVQAGEKSASSLLICFLLATIAVFAFMKIYTTSRVIQMNMEISLILAHVLAVILPNFSDNILVFCFNYLKSLIHTYYATEKTYNSIIYLLFFFILGMQDCVNFSPLLLYRMFFLHASGIPT